MRANVNRRAAFTLTEVLISMAVLALLVLLVTRLFNSASTVVTASNKRMDADGQARPLLDRMSLDLAQMLKRTDLDYYLKSPAVNQNGNDQLAFFSAVNGYYPASSYTSPCSLVAYRINAQNQLERMGKGLLWNGRSASDTPLVFLPMKINTTWPSATDMSTDTDYETIGSEVFRFEYQYLLRNGQLSDTPWDTTVAGHTAVAGLRDVAAISVVIAALDPRSRVLLSNTQLSTLATRLGDFSNGYSAGQLATSWQTTLDSINDMPRPAISAVRIYERYFYLSPHP